MTVRPRYPRPDATAVILARAGSKGLPGKNAMPLAGQPLATYTIRHARAASSLTRILVSTDCLHVRRAAEAEGVVVIDRPAELATDTATVDAAARHALADDHAPIAVILYANVPIRPPGLIDRAVQTLIETGADSVQSYAPVGKYHPYWEVTIDDAGRVAPFVPNSVYRRQDLPPVYIPDGGVIAVRRESLYHTIDGQPHAFLGRDRRAVLNEAGAVVDIDTRLDYLLAQLLLTEDAGGPPATAHAHASR